MTGIVLWGAAIYLCLIAVLFVAQRSLMYQPGNSLPRPDETLARGMETVRLSPQPDLTTVSWYGAPADGKSVILYFQGNAGTIADRDYKVRPWLDDGFGVFLLGYRGFGGNPGKPDEQGLYADARAALAWLAKRGIGAARIIIYGESLGTGVAVHMAFEQASAGNSVCGLILESPFKSMGAAAQDHYPYVPAKWLVRDRFASIDKIARIKAPLLVLHGEEDRVVGIDHGKHIFAAAVAPKLAHWIRGGGHSDLYDHGAGVKVLDFLRRSCA